MYLLAYSEDVCGSHAIVCLVLLVLALNIMKWPDDLVVLPNVQKPLSNERPLNQAGVYSRVRYGSLKHAPSADSSPGKLA